MKTITRWVGVVATVGMFAVLVMGATVTNTGSAHGCGRSWPLCHGQLIPQFAVSTAIEFSHRAVVGVETILILALAAGALFLYRDRREIKVLAPLMVAFLFLQAGLGAWAVMYPQVSAILALHFGVSLIAFASVLLTTVFLFEVDRTDRLRDRPVSAALRRYVWALTAYCYVVVYSGAYVRHANADDACSGWPLCNGSAVPRFHGLVAAAFGHRVAAAILTVGIAALLVAAWHSRAERPDLARAAAAAMLLVVGQVAAGAAVVWTGLDLFAALAHAALVGLMFGALTYLCVHVLPRDFRAAERLPTVARRSESSVAATPGVASTTR